MLVRFNTKFCNDDNLDIYNGQIAIIIDKTEYRWETRYTIKFKDGNIAYNIMDCELEVL